MISPECNVCHMVLDEEEHQPLNLGCSHDACKECVKGLINNGSLLCPMCRTVLKADKPEDLKVNHGVVQILRMLKELKVPENKISNEVGPKSTGTCRIHKQSLDLRCLSCKLWICVQCKQGHTPNIGCEVQDYNTYLKKLKEEHMQRTVPTLFSLKKNLKLFSSQISKIENKISLIELEKKKLENEHKTILEIVTEGSNTLKEAEKASADIEKAETLNELNERVNIFYDLQQFASIWCKKNPSSFFELLRSGLDVFATMNVNYVDKSGKVLIKDGNIYLHCLRMNEVNDTKSQRVYPYNQIMKWLPPIHNLVFFDLAIAGTIQGRVTIHLKQDLPRYAKNFPKLCTGEGGNSLLNLECEDTHENEMIKLSLNSISFAMKKFTRDTKSNHNVVPGSVIASYFQGQFSDLYIDFQQDEDNDTYCNFFEVFGQVESGLDVVKLCRAHTPQSEVTVADSGLVFKEDAVSKYIISDGEVVLYQGSSIIPKNNW